MVSELPGDIVTILTPHTASPSHRHVALGCRESGRGLDQEGAGQGVQRTAHCTCAMRRARRGDEGTKQIMASRISSLGAGLAKRATPLPRQLTAPHTQADDWEKTEGLQTPRAQSGEPHPASWCARACKVRS
jgi:hypothetical protein